ncbi:hypothetical protein [Sphingomonas sp. Leaf205]|uniref:hypothetical protein n=1 Tax=Sphingomonas sp. Leaf205 TaxID=2876551 RepID=UPI001E64554D|nr:hypothetical protein [Sphingomonas sp. Leaf205]
MVFLILAMAAAAAPAADQEVRGWTVSNAENSCTAERTYEDGTTVTFSLDHDHSDSDITLWNDRWQSISKEDTYQIAVQFDLEEPTVLKSSGMKTETAGGIYISTDGVPTIAAAMAANTVSFRNGSRLIGKYRLDGSNSALLAVARCNGRASTIISPDPFAK